MTAALRRFRTHVLNWRAWELNPIVVKELRQAVRSWAVPGVLLTFLIVLFIITVTFLATEGVAMNQSRELGKMIFGVFIMVLGLVSVIFIPALLARRVGEERQESNLDLLYISTLSPGRIVRGKFYCGAYIAILFFSACLPFMAFTNLLRGVDLPTVFLSLLYLFVAVCTLNQAAIFFACLPIGRAFKVVMVVFGFMVGSGIFGGLSLPFFRFGTSYWFRSSGTVDIGAWKAFALTVLAAGSVILLFYFLSVALISPHSSNRAKPVRLFLTSAWAFYGVWSILAAAHFGSTEALLPWASLSLVLMAMALLVVISNNDRLSARVRLDVPVAPGRRRLAYLFFNGAAGGLLWLMLLAGGTLAVIGLAAAFESYSSSSEELSGFFAHGTTLTCYALAYALAGLRLQRRFFPHHTPKVAAIITLLLAALWSLVPPILLFFANRLSVHALEKFQPGNIANVFMVRDLGQLTTHLVSSVVFLLVMLLLSARWFGEQWRNFKPPAPGEVPTPPPIPK